MEQRKTKGIRQVQTGGVGVVAFAVGIGIMLADFSPTGIGRTIAIGGLIFACYQALDRRICQRTQAADEQYRLGYDVGHERGHEEGFEKGLAAAVMKPVVVDLAAQRERRCDVAKHRAFSSASSVGDRD